MVGGEGERVAVGGYDGTGEEVSEDGRRPKKEKVAQMYIMHTDPVFFPRRDPEGMVLFVRCFGQKCSKFCLCKY